MQNRSWKCDVLRELRPGGKYLGLNLCRGVEISLVLRTPSGAAFLPFDSILDVLLHELTHIRFDAHNDLFYELYHTLRKEAGLQMPIAKSSCQMDTPPPVIPEPKTKQTNNVTSESKRDTAKQKIQKKSQPKACGCSVM